MAKATKKKDPAPAAQTAVAPDLVMVDFRLIDEDPNQPRKEFKVPSLQELAADIKQNGIIQPITVRPNPEKNTLKPVELVGKMHYTIVCGERRYRAAVMAELTEIPCIIRELTDDEALDLQISENLHRKDINPMEESDAFQRLIRRGLSTPEQIADKLGVSAKYVYDRLIMQKVIDKVQDSVRSGRLGITHAKQFARLPLADQEKLWEYEVDGVERQVDVEDLRDRISNLFTLKLENAIFDTTSKSLVKKAGACTECQHRTGCRMVLFEDFKQDDLCLKQECWYNKVEAHIEKTIADLQKKGKKVFLLSTYWTTTDMYLSRSSWAGIQSEQETDFVGVIREAKVFASEKIGDLIYLESDPTEEKVEEDENNQDDGTEIRKAPKSKLAAADNFSMEMTSALLNVFLNYSNLYESLLPVNNLINAISRKYAQLEEETISLINEKLGIEVIKDEDNYELLKDSMKAYCERFRDDLDNLTQLFHLMETISDIDEFRFGWDDEVFAEMTERLQSVNIYPIQIAKQVEEKTGEKLIHEEVN